VHAGTVPPPDIRHDHPIVSKHARGSRYHRLDADPTRLRSRKIAERLHALVPGGAHTYARGDDQYPDGMAPVLVSGRGCRVRDADGLEYVEYGADDWCIGHTAMPAGIPRGIDSHLHGRPVKPVFRPYA